MVVVQAVCLIQVNNDTQQRYRTAVRRSGCLGELLDLLIRKNGHEVRFHWFWRVKVVMTSTGCAASRCDM